jgi:hypothetical protein
MLPIQETLVLVRLHEWARDRVALRSGRIGTYKRQGWIARRATCFDARLVRVIDIERALSHLSNEERTLLVLTYGDGRSREETAALAGMSVRAAIYKLREARQRLAAVMDRLDLL